MSYEYDSWLLKCVPIFAWILNRKIRNGSSLLSKSGLNGDSDMSWKISFEGKTFLDSILKIQTESWLDPYLWLGDS